MSDAGQTVAQAGKATLHERLRGSRSVRVYPAPGLDEHEGQETKVGCRILAGSAMGHARGLAKEWARKNKSADPKDGDPNYDMALKAAIVSMGVTQPVEDPNAPLLYPGGFEEVIHELDDDVISYLYAIWEQHRERMSPMKLSIEPAEFLNGVRVMADDDESAALVFFSRLHPGTQLTFTRLLAALYVSAHWTKSSSSSGSTGSENTSGNTASSPSDPSAATGPTMATATTTATWPSTLLTPEDLGRGQGKDGS